MYFMQQNLCMISSLARVNISPTYKILYSTYKYMHSVQILLNMISLPGMEKNLCIIVVP